MEVKLFDSELKVMDVLWREGDATAKYISEVLRDEVGWNKNTTYTLIKRCMKKGAIERLEPNFMCRALTREPEAAKEPPSTVSKKYCQAVCSETIGGLPESPELKFRRKRSSPTMSSALTSLQIFHQLL